jgi:hypothetical protein
MRPLQLVLALSIAACSSVSQGDTKPIFTLKAVTEYASWIAVGRIQSVRDAGCSTEGFGKAAIATLVVDEVWKGALGGAVEFAFFPDKATVRPQQGGQYVIAFQTLHVPCANVSYDEGFLPVEQGEVVTDRLVNEPPRQRLDVLANKVRALTMQKSR